MRYLPQETREAGESSDGPDLEFVPRDGGPIRAYTFVELSRAAEAHAADLRRAGVEAGDRIVLHLDNSPELIVAVFGNHLAGAITVPVNPATPEAELVRTARRADVAGVVADDPHLLDEGAFDLRLRLSTGELRERLGPGGEADGKPEGRAGCEEGPAGSDEGLEIGSRVPPSERLPENRDPDAGAFLVFTSGTTGRPKGVLLSHRNVRSNLADLIDVWRWTAADRLLLALPLFHVHGLGLGVHGWALTGCSLVVMEHFDATRVLELLEERRCTMVFGVPTMYRRLVDAWDPERHDPSRLRLAVTGSAGMPVDLHRRCREMLGEFPLERYGMTETMMNSSNPFEDRKPGTVGMPLPSVDLRLVDDDGRVVEEPEEPGEIRVRGPNVFSGYWRDPEATEEAFVDGWFRTGDLGCWDEDGYLRHLGRLKVDFIKSGGYRVGAREVEEVLEGHGSVVEAAVVGLPDDDLGERVVAFVVAADETLGEEELLARCRERLALFKCPREVIFLDRLPKNPMGKVRKPDIVKRWGASDLPGDRR